MDGSDSPLKKGQKVNSTDGNVCLPKGIGILP